MQLPLGLWSDESVFRAVIREHLGMFALFFSPSLSDCCGACGLNPAQHAEPAMKPLTSPLLSFIALTIRNALFCLVMEYSSQAFCVSYHCCYTHFSCFSLCCVRDWSCLFGAISSASQQAGAQLVFDPDAQVLY